MSARSRKVPAHLAGLVVEPEPSPAPSGSTPSVRATPARTSGIDAPHDASVLAHIVAATPSRVAAGRTGTRYRTQSYLELRADHAIAKDAVHASIPRETAARLGCIEVVSRCPDREHYLLHPNDGRRLSSESRALLDRDGTHGADVQVILADGLAAPALDRNGPALLPSLTAALQRRGLSVGRPVLARMARVGLQDDIGVLLGSKATLICLGERPGLGTGDSMSIYIAVAPRLDQDNAEKNCISNIRPQGLSPEKAAEEAADIVARGIAAGRGGLALARS
jgi:ethanolamine ammonia-lyase small subunit